MELQPQPLAPQPQADPSAVQAADPLAGLSAQSGQQPGQPAQPQVQPDLKFDEKRHGDALLKLQDQYEQEDLSERLRDVRNVKKARAFWKGDQYLWYDEVLRMFRTLADRVGTDAEDLDAVYQYVTNIYQGYGLSFVATVSQQPPTVRFFPRDSKKPEDRATADGASAVSEQIQRNNDMDTKSVEEALYLWTDGMFGLYTRYVADQERYGLIEQDVMGSQEVRLPDTMQCNCGYSELVENPDISAPPTQPAPCPDCGSMMTVIPGGTTTQPVKTGTIEVPNGEVVIDVAGKLEVRLPTFTRDFLDAPYLQYAVEVPKGKVRTLYPEKAKDLENGDGAGEIEERNARIDLTTERRAGATKSSSNLLTFKRTWFRPWAFALLDDDQIVKELATLFPRGVMVASVGRTLCETRAESVDDHWVICFAYPGDGTTKPSVGGSLISIQERYNTLCNIEVETHEHGIPTLFVDAHAINMQAWRDEGNKPGLTWPVETRNGLPVQSQMFQTEPAPVSPQIAAHRSELMGQVSQFLTGLFPALFGGGAIGNDTASGYAMQRDQAMGRMSLPWKQLKKANSKCQELSVEVFRKSKTGKVAVTVMKRLGEFETKLVHLDAMTGHFWAYPETAEDFPMTWTQKRNAFTDFINSPLANLLNTPANMDALTRTLGPLDLEFPGAEARVQQMHETEDLLQSAPNMVQQPGPMGISPQDMAPTVEVDAELDDHVTHMQAIQEWAASQEGRAARQDNPQGFLNVKLHFMQHANIVAQKQAQEAAANAAAPNGQSPAGAPQGQSQGATA